MYNDVKIGHIVATDRNHAIGAGNTLPWHIPDDLIHFKNITSEGILIMGRKTFLSIGRALPNRTTYVVTSDATKYNADGIANLGQVILVDSIERALDAATKKAKNKNIEQVWVVGGQTIYTATMSYVDIIEMTHVNTIVDNADTYYPQVPESFNLEKASQMYTDKVSYIDYLFATYIKVD